MKKIFLLAIFVTLLIAAPFAVSAIDLGADLAGRAAQGGGFGAATETTFAEIIGEIIKTLLGFVGVIFLVLMVYAGFLWMNARGDEAEVQKSQSIIRAAIIGLIITVSAYSITAFIVPRIVERTAGPGTPGGGGPGAAPGQGVGCCLLEDESGDAVSHLIVNSENECEAGGFGGCVPGINFDDCEFSITPTANDCAIQVRGDRL